VAAGRFINIR